MTTTPPAELAPSEIKAEEPAFPRLVGVIGLCAATLGLIAIIANQYEPRLVGTSGGYLFVAFGLAGLLYHALRDGNVEFRRAYFGVGAFFLAAAIVAAVVPGPIFSDAVAKTSGYHLLPWTPTFGLLGLAFLVAPLRRETDAGFRNLTQLILLGVGGLLCVGSVVAGLNDPDFLVGAGILLAIVGLCYLAAFLSHTDTSQGLGYGVAFALGALGTLLLVYATAKAMLPTVLADGPNAILKENRSLDYWKLLPRLAVILGCLGFSFWAFRKQAGAAKWLLILIGLAFAATFSAGLFKRFDVEPKAFIVPYGLLFGLIGLTYLSVSAATVSDSAFIALLRREIAAFFFSPIVYILLFGIALVAMFGHLDFLGTLDDAPAGVPEPILQHDNALGIIAVFAVVFVVPAITMRAFSDEKRSGTLEVLLTAPVSETAIVLSKFLSCWLMYMLTFVPAGLYLIALRIEGGNSFDYRPLLSYYLAVGLCGIAFVGMGLFFSSLTKNQIIAAVLTFAGMIFLLLTIMLKRNEFLGRGVQAVLEKLDFYTLWHTALSGTLPVMQGVAFASLGVFWLFLTVKTLEARKWG